MKPRFSIRDLLWLLVVVALAVGWYIDHLGQQQKFAALQVHLDQAQRAMVIMATESQPPARKPGP